MRVHLAGEALGIGQIGNGIAHGAPGEQIAAVVRVDQRADLFLDAGRLGRALARRHLMPLPILAGTPLRQQQRIAAMRFGRRLPDLALVRTDADKENPQALLRDAIVRRVHQLERDVVFAGGARLLLPFAQARQMIAPCLKWSPPAEFNHRSQQFKMRARPFHKDKSEVIVSTRTSLHY